MTVDERPRSPDSNDDPATNAAREELRQTSISDKSNTLATTETSDPTTAPPESAKENSATPELPPSDIHDEEMRERLGSPKKKRGRDQDDDGAALGEGLEQEEDTAANGGVTNGSRPQGQEPQKKRVRDGSEDRLSDNAKEEVIEEAAANSNLDVKKPSTGGAAITSTGDKTRETAQTSASAFASSGFASMANSTSSPFGVVGASKPSVFGGGVSTTTSGFGALAGSKSPPQGSTLTSTGFGALGNSKAPSTFGFGGSSTSGFGGLSGGGSVFGSALSNGFGGSSGHKLSSFAAAGTAAPSTSKPAKAFGAPDSDEGEDTDGGDDDDRVGSAEEDKRASSPEEKKKLKPQKVQIEDGEAGEATLLHVRAKLFALTSTEDGWKERGVGMLKINVPESNVEYDEEGHAMPGSYTKSFEDDIEAAKSTPSVPRLILRQENTHRVILNTALAKHMIFKDKPATNSAQIQFTAIEGDQDPKPVSMLLKMNENNASLFRSEVASIQEQL